jgi:hypothetical protein
MPSWSLFRWLCPGDTSNSQFPGGARATAYAGKGRHPHPRFCSKRLRLWPETMMRAKPLTQKTRRKRKRSMPLFADLANNDSAQTLRLFRAFW